tara:strand:- start:242 stop:475 length:234 start_codon:yes stop_codon:yes gene_type:complete
MNKIVIIKTNGHIIKNFSKKLKLNLNSKTKTKGTIAIDNKNEAIQAIKSPILSRPNLKLQNWHFSFNLKILLNIKPL